MNIFYLFSDFKFLKTVNLFLKFFMSLIDGYILLWNGQLYLQVKAERLNY